MSYSLLERLEAKSRMKEQEKAGRVTERHMYGNNKMTLFSFHE